MRKTAYELRISDWSSDVCSSDLLVEMGAQPGQLLGLGQLVGLDHLVEAGGVDLVGILGREPAVGQPRLPAGRARGHLVVEIGRASCRGRVCKYGVDLGGRRLIQKKESRTEYIERK